MKLATPMKFAPDLARLDHSYRAKRSAVTPSEYAASVEIYRRPRRFSWPLIFTAVLLLGAALIARA